MGGASRSQACLRTRPAAAALPEPQLELWRDFARAEALETSAASQAPRGFDILQDFFHNTTVGSSIAVGTVPADEGYANMTFAHDLENAALAKHNAAHKSSSSDAYPDAAPSE